MMVEASLGFVVMVAIVLLARPVNWTKPPRLRDVNWPLLVVLGFWTFVLYHLFYGG